MRIAFVSLMSGSPWAASEVLWAETARVALEKGHEVLISTYNWPDRPPALQELERLGAHLHLRTRSRWCRRSALLTLLDRTFQPLQQFNPDVTVVSQGGSYDIARSGSTTGLRNMLKLLRTPYVLLCHCEQPGPDRRNLRRAQQIFMRAAIVGMLADKLRVVAETHLRMPLPNARIFHNPVNLKRIGRLPWPSANGPLRLAFVGRLEPVKNLESLLDALAQESWTARHWTLTVYGAGPDRDMLEQKARQKSLQDKLRFAGYVHDIASVWETHHALVLPSRFEGVPLAMIEAMLCGRPVVAANIGGISEWLEEGRSGFLVRQPIPEEIAAALERLWDRRADLEQMGRYAHEDTMQRRDSDPAGTLLQWVDQAAATRPYSAFARESASAADTASIEHPPRSTR